MDAIHLPNAITLPTAFGAPGTPLPAGQVVQALVLELIQSDVFRLQMPQAVVDVVQFLNHFHFQLAGGRDHFRRLSGRAARGRINSVELELGQLLRHFGRLL